jgi:hypothetical protein
VLGNTWWGFEDSKLSLQQRKALLFWLNSTLSILSYFGRRAITEGAWMQMKKPAWASMLVLDVRHLSKSALTALAESYDSLCHEELGPIAQLNTDQIRKQIDDQISKVLRIPKVDPIRELLAREPGLTAHDITPRRVQTDLPFDDPEGAETTLWLPLIST